MKRLLRTYRITSSIAFILVLTAFLLLLLVGISLTIIKPIYLLVFQSTANNGPITSIATELRFGVWGVCATGALNAPTLFRNDGLCFGPQLGYKVPDYIRVLIGVSPALVDTVETALLVVLVLHPISAGLAFLTLVSSLFLSVASRVVAILTLVLAVVTALLSSVVLGIDLALVIVARNEVRRLEEFRFDVQFGNGVWMVLAAVVCLWIAVVFLSARACYCCGVRRADKDEPEYQTERY